MAAGAPQPTFIPRPQISRVASPQRRFVRGVPRSPAGSGEEGLVCLTRSKCLTESRRPPVPRPSRSLMSTRPRPAVTAHLRGRSAARRVPSALLLPLAGERGPQPTPELSGLGRRRGRPLRKAAEGRPGSRQAAARSGLAGTAERTQAALLFSAPAASARSRAPALLPAGTVSSAGRPNCFIRRGSRFDPPTSARRNPTGWLPRGTGAGLRGCHGPAVAAAQRTPHPVQLERGGLLITTIACILQACLLRSYGVPAPPGAQVGPVSKPRSKRGREP